MIKLIIRLGYLSLQLSIGRSPGFLDIEAIKKIWVTRGAVVVTVDFRSEVLGFWQYGSSDHNNGLQGFSI